MSKLDRWNKFLSENGIKLTLWQSSIANLVFSSPIASGKTFILACMLKFDNEDAAKDNRQAIRSNKKAARAFIPVPK